MDLEAERTLRALKLRGVDVISVAELERADPELAAVKPARTHAEYCWTAASVLCWHCFEREPELSGITYLDADMEFFSDPAPLFDELAHASVLLSPHRHSDEFRTVATRDGRYEEPGGLFNVQFTAFRRDAAGLAALKWWRERCIESVRNRVEPGRYAGQKYLDELPGLFDGVLPMAHIGGGLAPWNISRYRIERRDDVTMIDGVPLIFHHFQSFEPYAATSWSRLLAARTRAFRATSGSVPTVWTTGWRLTESQLALLWDPYARRVSQAVADVRAAGGDRAAPLSALPPRRAAFHILRRRLPTPIRSAYWRWRTESRRFRVA